MGRGYEESELIKLAMAAVKRYSQHPDWEDIKQEAVLGAIQAVGCALKSGKCKWTTAAHAGARWAATNYLHPENRRYKKRKGPEMVSLEVVMQSHGEDNAWEPPVDDFAPGFIERYGLWQEVVRHASPIQLEAAERCWWGDETMEEAAQAIGVSKAAVCNRLVKLRRRLLAELNPA